MRTISEQRSKQRGSFDDTKILHNNDQSYFDRSVYRRCNYRVCGLFVAVIMVLDVVSLSLVDVSNCLDSFVWFRG